MFKLFHIMKVSCGIMLNNNGKILMGQRSKEGANPDYWEFPGGQCENNETLEDCLHREWKEELDLSITINELFHSHKNNDVECFFYIGLINNTENIKMNVHQEIGFYDVNELNNLYLFEEDQVLIPIIRNYIQNNKMKVI